ncbi:uncharacterized protein LOC131009951 [Salvia miltiorrhiza]|uniref:uncharacterized protein LOC131009951 n=1 Tax=Salvia miltiorrhiza TaxID=226208 RepID=UPI0025AD7BD3|nr:uncharacterized protein LOC131009951 [Salvia miltiorrhiza]
MERATDLQLVSPAVLGMDKISVSHLQYADDTIFLLAANEGNVNFIKRILLLFQFLSGLKINFDKSNLMAVGVENTCLRRWAGYLNCKEGSLPFNYLGIKVGGRMNSSVEWSCVVEKVLRKIRGWKKKSLSLAGRIVLVKSVLQAIPVFQLSFSFIPKSVIHDLNSVFGKFLWGGSGVSRSIAWFKWKDMCVDKLQGGLGFRNIEWFNKVLVFKWVWRYLVEREALWVRVIKSLYGDLSRGEGGGVEGGEKGRDEGMVVENCWEGGEGGRKVV